MTKQERKRQADKALKSQRKQFARELDAWFRRKNRLENDILKYTAAQRELGEKLVEMGSSRMPIKHEKLGVLMNRLACAYVELILKCDHRWVRKGAKSNRPSGWLECVNCHRKKRVITWATRARSNGPTPRGTSSRAARKSRRAARTAT